VCRAQGRELLLGIIAGPSGELPEDTVARVLARIYELGIRPDWWQLEPQASAAAWQGCVEVIAANDQYCRGIVVGLELPLADTARALALAAATPLVRGLITGRSIFDAAAQRWLSGQLSADAAIEDIAERFRALTEVWSSVRGARLERAERSAI
jgi:5-dehydro-2-deoxygluconokinase